MIQFFRELVRRPYAPSAAVLWAALSTPIHAQPSDLEAALRDNLDKIQFRSFAVSRTGQFEDGTWICGTMSARTSFGEYLDFKFVAQLYPPEMQKIGLPRSWITLVGPGAVDISNLYGQHCGK